MWLTSVCFVAFCHSDAKSEICGNLLLRSWETLILLVYAWLRWYHDLCWYLSVPLRMFWQTRYFCTYHSGKIAPWCPMTTTFLFYLWRNLTSRARRFTVIEIKSSLSKQPTSVTGNSPQFVPMDTFQVELYTIKPWPNQQTPHSEKKQLLNIRILTQFILY